MEEGMNASVKEMSVDLSYEIESYLAKKPFLLLLLGLLLLLLRFLRRQLIPGIQSLFRIKDFCLANAHYEFLLNREELFDGKGNPFACRSYFLPQR